MSNRIDSSEKVQSFYDRWAGLYDLVSRYTPGIRHVRRQAVDSLHLESGDTVVDMGCGTGANLPYLRDAVGAEGRVIGIDITQGMLEQAKSMVEKKGWDNVNLVQADATQPQIEQSVDGILSTFVLTMFEDPVKVLERWEGLVDGGYISAVNFDRSRQWYAPAVNTGLKALIAVSTPPTLRLQFPADVYEEFYRQNDRIRQTYKDGFEDVKLQEHLLGTIYAISGKPRQ